MYIGIEETGQLVPSTSLPVSRMPASLAQTDILDSIKDDSEKRDYILCRCRLMGVKLDLQYWNEEGDLMILITDREGIKPLRHQLIKVEDQESGDLYRDIDNLLNILTIPKSSGTISPSGVGTNDDKEIPK